MSRSFLHYLGVWTVTWFEIWLTWKFNDIENLQLSLTMFYCFSPLIVFKKQFLKFCSIKSFNWWPTDRCLGKIDINIKQMAELKWISNPRLHPFDAVIISQIILRCCYWITCFRILNYSLITYYINNHYMRYVLVLL